MPQQEQIVQLSDGSKIAIPSTVKPAQFDSYIADFQAHKPPAPPQQTPSAEGQNKLIRYMVPGEGVNDYAQGSYAEQQALRKGAKPIPTQRGGPVSYQAPSRVLDETPEQHAQRSQSETKDLHRTAGEAGAVVAGGIAAPALVPEAAGGVSGLLLRMLATGGGAGAGTMAGRAATGDVSTEGLKQAGVNAAEYGLGEGAGEVIGKGAGALVKKMGEPITRINKLLGVAAKDVRLGSMPAELDEFAGQPARGVMKSGLDEKTLAKMNPIERNMAVVKAKNVVGKELDQILTQASNEGKIVNVQKPVEDVFKNIPDKKLRKQATTKFLQILQQNGITKPISQLSPMEARTVQRGLDDFANFTSADANKTFRDVATNLRRGISAETRKVVPAVTAVDQHYGDLALANQATRKAASKYASTVPQNKLRKWIVGSAIGGSAAGAGYELMKHALGGTSGGSVP
jgi:hypothetical protein